MNIAFIPMRGGSKSILRKNIRILAGKPLCYWAIKAAVEAEIFAQIIISTDSEEIISIVESFGFPVKCLRRPTELAQDDTSTENVMLHELKDLNFDTVTLIQVTTPYIKSVYLKEAYKEFYSENLDSLLSCANTGHFFWKSDGRPLNYTPENRPRRQDFKSDILTENGSFYIVRKHILFSMKCRLGGKTGIYEMPGYTIYEIDEEEDWIIAQRLMHKHLLSEKKNIQIKLFACDVDGVLTDAGMYYSESGDELKKFNTRDGKGFELLRNANIKTAFITSEKTDLVEKRAAKLKIDYLIQGVSGDGKLNAIKDICKKSGIKLQDVAYIGDDINCIDILSHVGIPACPADAVEAVKNIPGILQLTKRGGEGVAREFIDSILSHSE